MPKKIQDCSKAHLISIDLPVHGDSYTVISHESVMDYVFTELANAGFGIVTEDYRATADGQIAQGIYRLNYNSDPELSMMFAWTNSYNKQVRFKCGVGAYVNQIGTVMVCGDMGSWARKHTGSADEETVQTIKDQITDAKMYYNQLVADKEAMKGISMTKRKQSQLLGILFAEYKILTTEQASMIRNEMDKPSHVFDDTNSLWAFYNYVTTALQHSHPKTWMEDQRVLHYFISTVNNFSSSQVAPQVQSVIEAVVDPLTTNYGQPENQLNILTEIERTEAGETSLELEANLDLAAYNQDLEIEDAVEELDCNITIDEVIIYTDPVGNTFEAPMVPPCAAHDSEPGDEEDDWMILPPDESLEEFEVDDNQEWTGENATTMSLEPTPEDHKNYEANLSTLVVEEEKKDDDFDFDLSEVTEDEDDGGIPDFF
tara:strand:- start:1208 stop:2494 length:1287 start_codon:yes stop_codon:yes gene_type:complete